MPIIMVTTFYFRSNVLIDKYYNGKIGDFGFTENMPCTSSNIVVLRTAKCIAKSMGYAAPEVDLHRHSVLTDMYAYGVVSYRLNCN